MLGLMGMCVGVFPWGGVKVGRCVGVVEGVRVRGVCVGMREGVSELSADCMCALRSYEGVRRRSSMLQSASLGGELMEGSLSEGGWMEIQGGLIFFFLCPPPTDCTRTGTLSGRGLNSGASSLVKMS